MKIVQINSSYGIDSIGRTTSELDDYLLSHGYDSYVFYTLGNVKKSNVIKVGSFLERKVHALFSRLTGLQGYYSCFSTYRMVLTLKRLKPDIIHIRNLHSNYVNLNILFNYIKKNNVGVVITLHDCWTFTGKCVHPSLTKCNKFKFRCGPCPQIKMDNINPVYFGDRSKKCQNDKYCFYHSIAHNKLQIVGVSKWIASEAKESYVMQDLNITYIYNWINQDVFHYGRNKDVEKKYGIPSDKTIIIIVAAIMLKTKGYREICDLSSSLSSDYQFIFVGKGNKRLPLPSNVIHIRHTNDASELAALYSVATVCLNVTSHESFGKVTAEAISCGTPVIVYNNSASPELVGEGCGYVVNQNSGTEEIAKKIKQIRMNGKDFYKNQCINFAKAHFDKDKCIAQYLEIYNKICSH